MSRPAAALVTEELVAPAAGAVDSLRSRLAGRAARRHVVLELLDEELAQARAALGELAGYVATVEAALADEAPSQRSLLALALGGAPVERVERLGAALAGVRRRLAQLAARM